MTCTHPERVRVVSGQRAEWCKACGAVFDGHTWHKPELAKAVPRAHAAPAPAHIPRRPKRARAKRAKVTTHHRVAAHTVKKRTPKRARKAVRRGPGGRFVKRR